MLSGDQILSNVNFNTNEYSFVDTLASFINNRDFKLGYIQEKDGIDSKQSYFWRAMKEIGQEVGEVTYENVLNYIDRIANIDLCKIQALKSILKSFGVELNILENINVFPEDIIKLMDVLSINKKYLLSDNILKMVLADDIKNSILKQGNDNNLYNVIEDLTNINRPGYITTKDYEYYIKEIFKNYITSIINMTYCKEDVNDNNPIWFDERREIVEGLVDTTWNSQILQFKHKYNIPYNFNQDQIVDNIEKGIDDINNYSGYYKDLIKLEVDHRNETLKGYENSLITRYSFYRKQKVQEYIQFVEQQYNGRGLIDQILSSTYNIDGNYFELSSSTYKHLISKIDNRIDTLDNYVVDNEMIDNIATTIAKLTISISKLRDSVKTQTLKSYAKGTFNLLAFLINEYLIEYANSRVLEPSGGLDNFKLIRSKLSSHSIDAVKLIEYIDTTEYFNIKTANSRNAYNRSKVNDRYWEGESDSNTNSGFAFKDSDISTFYVDKLNIKVNDLDNFLQDLYKLGATPTYISRDEENLCASTGNDEMFLTYNGTKYGLNPVYNYKNKTHSSYQVHPYLKNFIEYTGVSYPIVNGFFNDTVDNLADELVLANLSNSIGEFGLIINVAANNSYDFSGYRSRYETYPHAGSNEIFGYDGIFYPPAIEDFLNDTDEFISLLSNCYTGTAQELSYFEKYYQPLNLNNNEYIFIAKQLKEYESLLRQIADSDQTSKYDIFKYGKDKYDNAYILIKEYDNANASFIEKQNTPGQLWIKKKDHPIAFPALYGNYPQVENDSSLNQSFKYLATNHDIVSDRNHMSYFYDIDFSSTKDTLFAMVYPVNDVDTSDLKNNGNHTPSITDPLFKDIQHCDILISLINEDFDIKEQRGKLFFKANEVSYISNDKESKPHMDASFDSESSLIFGFTFVGMYKNGSAVSPIFIKKYYDKTTHKYHLYDSNETRIYTFVDGRQEGLAIHPLLTFENTGYDVFEGDIRFAQNGNTLTFVTLAEPKNKIKQKIVNYIGVSTGNGLTEYLSGSSTIDEDTSSLDRMNQFIRVTDVKIVGGEFSIPKSKIYNLNSDASYIPLYAGPLGINDITNSTYLNKNIHSLELLGNSFNDFDRHIRMVNPYADPNIDLQDLKEKYTYGAVYEDYNEEEDTSLREFVLKQLNIGVNLGSFTWTINLGYLPDDKRMNSKIIFYNTNSCGKNPYFIGSLSSLSASSVSLKNAGTYNYQDEFRDIPSLTISTIKASGTYNFYDGKINRDDSNHLYNIDDIEMLYIGVDNGITFNELRILFNPISSDITYAIRDNSVKVLVCNDTDLSVFEKYHLMEPKNIGQKSLSSININDYTSLSDISVLSGTDNLAFKYHEKDIFELSSKMYYFPMINTAYPMRPLNVLDFDNPEKSTINMYSSKDTYNNSNLYIFRVDDSLILNKIGNVELLLDVEANDALIVTEDYLSDDNYNKVDKNSAEIAKFILFDESEDSDPNEVKIPPYENRVTYSRFLEALETNNHISASITEEISKSNIDSYLSVYQDSKTLSGADDLFNIYVNYKRESNGSITLYFNYINYLNTPFIKVEDGVSKMDLIPNTYLRLNGSIDGKGQDGILDIYTQYKYYHDSINLAGVANIKLVSYRIFNVSDDKPKFLILKISEVTRDSHKHTPLTGDLSIIGNCDDVYLDNLSDNDHISVSLNVSTMSNKTVANGEYYIRYQSNKLSTLLDPERRGLIIINDFSQQNIVFESIQAIKDIDLNTDIKYMFRFKGGNIIDKDNLKFNVYTENTSVNIKFETVLRLESDNKLDIITTEDNEKIKLI